MKKGFDWRPFLKGVAVIAIPVALQNLLTTTGSMVDTMMVASLGELTVGAIGLCAQLSSLMFACYWGFVGGGMLFFSQYWGAKDEDGIDRSYGMTLVCMMTVAVLFCIAGTCFPHTVMRIYTDKPHVQELGVQYLRIAGFAYPMMVFSMAMSALLRSTERVRIPLYGSIASVCTNIFLNWVLIFGRFGLPRMEIRGAALATVIASFVNCVVVLLCARAKGYPYLFHFRRHFRWSGEKAREYIRKCFPIICNELLIGVGGAVISMVLGRQSEAAIAAVAVFRTLEGLVIGFFAGFSNAASVLVGKCVGSGELETAYQRAKRLVLLCGTTILCVCGLMMALHSPILHVMSLQGESFRIGRGILGIYCIAAIIRMCNWVMNDTYRSAGDAVTGTVLEIVFMYAMLLPAVCLTGLKLKASIFLVFGCCYIDEPIRFVIMQRHMYTGKWIRPVTPQGQDAIPAFRAARTRGKA